MSDDAKLLNGYWRLSAQPPGRCCHMPGYWPAQLGGRCHRPVKETIGGYALCVQHARITRRWLATMREAGVK